MRDHVQEDWDLYLETMEDQFKGKIMKCLAVVQGRKRFHCFESDGTGGLFPWKINESFWIVPNTWVDKFQEMPHGTATVHYLD